MEFPYFLFFQVSMNRAPPKSHCIRPFEESGLLSFFFFFLSQHVETLDFLSLPDFCPSFLWACHR